MKETFDQQALATNWDLHWKTISGNSLIEKWRAHSVWSGYQRLLRGILFPSNPRILELGAGTGHISLKLIQKFGGHATLVESNPTAIAYSKELWSRAGLMESVTHFQGGIFEFSNGEEFDLVHSGGVIEHFHGPDKAKIVETHVKWANKTGRIVVVLPIKGLRYYTFKTILSLLGRWIYTDEVPWRRREVDSRFKEHGYRVTRQTVIGHERGYLLEVSAC